MLNQRMIYTLLAQQQLALDAGNPPFSAVIACDGHIIAATANTSRTTGNPLHHAEMLAIQDAIVKYGPAILQESHLFASNEPCPMCMGACIWSGIRNVTYYLSQEQIFAIRGWGRFIPAQAVANADDSGVCISGPVGNHEMLQMHEKFWTADRNLTRKHTIHLE